MRARRNAFCLNGLFLFAAKGSPTTARIQADDESEHGRQTAALEDKKHK